MNRPRWTGHVDFMLGGSSWDAVEEHYSEVLATTKHGRRRAALDERVDAKLEQVRTWGESISAAVDAAPADGDFVLTDRDLDLRWLRSPWTIYRYARKRSRDLGASRPSSADLLV